MYNSFKILVPSYNAKQWADNCLSSIAKQQFSNFDVCVIDDCSDTDESRDIIKKYCEENNWNYIFNKDRKYTLLNIDLGIQSFNPKDDDVIVMVDGDDWLFDNTVLSKLHDYYQDDICLTYGQYIEDNMKNDSKTYCFMPEEEIISKKLYRQIPWLFTHLKTFKYQLFKNINKQHFKDRDGKYFKTASDLAIMFPMVEMAGTKFRCINDIMYVYNTNNPISDFRINLSDQRRVDGLIRRLPKYPTIAK